MKLKKTEFFILNNGLQEAPADMLRYDGAFASELFPYSIAFPTFKTKDGDLYGNVTEGRWRSFGCRLDTMDKAIARELAWDIQDHPEQWFTYRSFHRGDNHQMVKFTFADYLNNSLKQLEEETEKRATQEKK